MNNSHYTTEDKARLRPGDQKIADAMADGQFHTLDNLATSLGMRSGTVASRLRDLKATGFFGYDRMRDKDVKGLHWYRLYRIVPGQLPLFEGQQNVV